MRPSALVAGVAVCPVPSAAPALIGGWSVPKYVVTGGEDGQSGVVVGGKRYEPGETVEIAAGKKDWRIDAGYLELASKAKRARDDNGHFVPDDPATPENEAFEPAPKKAGGK